MYTWNFGKYCSNTPNIVRRSLEWISQSRKKWRGDSQAALQEHCGDGVNCIWKLWSYKYDYHTLIWVKYLFPSLLPCAKNLYLDGANLFFNAALNSVMSESFVISFGVCSYFIENNTKKELENFTFPHGKERNVFFISSVVSSQRSNSGYARWNEGTLLTNHGLVKKCYPKTLALTSIDFHPNSILTFSLVVKWSAPVTIFADLYCNCSFLQLKECANKLVEHNILLTLPAFNKPIYCKSLQTSNAS